MWSLWLWLLISWWCCSLEMCSNAMLWGGSCHTWRSTTYTECTLISVDLISTLAPSQCSRCANYQPSHSATRTEAKSTVNWQLTSKKELWRSFLLHLSFVPTLGTFRTVRLASSSNLAITRTSLSERMNIKPLNHPFCHHCKLWSRLCCVQVALYSSHSTFGLSTFSVQRTHHTHFYTRYITTLLQWLLSDFSITGHSCSRQGQFKRLDWGTMAAVNGTRL